MKDNSTKNEFIELRAAGLTYETIAIKLNVSKRTLINWSKDFEHEIANLKALELESLQNKYYMNREKKITLFGEKFNEIVNELNKRDLSEVPTEKLFDLMMKYSDFLTKERVELTLIAKREDVLDFEQDTREWKG